MTTETTNPRMTDIEEARAYFAREAMNFARGDVARAIFEHVVTNISRVAASMPAGSLVRDFAAGLPPGDDARDAFWIEAFSTAVRALERPHYNASLDRWQRARDYFNLGNDQEREEGAAGLYAWWVDDAPAMCRMVVESPVANNAVLQLLGLEPEPEQPTIKRSAKPMPASVLQELLAESWMTPGAPAWWWSQKNTIEPVTIVEAANWLGGDIRTVIETVGGKLAGIPTRELRPRRTEGPAGDRWVFDVSEMQKHFMAIEGELAVARGKLEVATHELEETRKATALELSVMREQRDAARTEAAELRARIEAPSDDSA